MLVRVEHAHDQPADAEDDHRQQHDAHQFGGEHLRGRRGIRHEQSVRQRVSQGEGQRRQHRRSCDQQGDHAVGESLRSGLVAAGQEAGEDGDERRAERPARHQHEERLRHALSGHEGIERRPRPERRVDRRLAHHAEHGAGDEGQHDDGGGAGDLPARQRAGGGCGICHRLAQWSNAIRDSDSIAGAMTNRKRDCVRAAMPIELGVRSRNRKSS